MTVMTAENPGRWKRRCDATCHNAKGTHCACICNGRYHGAALERGGIMEALRKTQIELAMTPKATPGEQQGERGTT